MIRAKYELVVLLIDELYHVPLEGKLFGSRFNIVIAFPLGMYLDFVIEYTKGGYWERFFF